MHVGDEGRRLRPGVGVETAPGGPGEGRDQGPAPLLHTPRRSSVEPTPVTNLTTTSATTTTVSTSVQAADARVSSGHESSRLEAQSEPAPRPERQSARHLYQAARALARQGNPDAQVDLAMCYVDGRGVKKNWTKAAKWLHLSVEQGNCFARAYCLWHGIGMQTNLAAAVELYMLAVASGNTNAMWRLGLCYERGWCVEASDANIALQMFQLAAMKGNVDAQFHLARCYYHGIGTPKSKMEAVYWFALSEGVAASAAAQPMRLLELLEQALRDFDTALQEELPRIEGLLARVPEPEPELAPAPAAGDDSPDNSDGEPAGRAADPGAPPPSHAGKGLPRLQELSEPSSTPSTESGHSGEADEGDEADFEWQADLQESSTTIG